MKKEEGLVKKLGETIRKRKIFTFTLSNIDIYGFVGPSGTGKSFRAWQVAYEKGIEAIIDDGLLIMGSRVLAGVSAKTAKTKVQTVRQALFSTEEEKEAIKTALRKEKVKSLLILGTSDGMVEKIRNNLKLPEFKSIIRIEEVATKEEMEMALKIRKTQGKHIVPVPTFEIQKDFSGILLDPLRKFKGKRKIQKEGTYIPDRSIIRPAFSYFGKYTIKDKAFRDMITIASARIEGIYSVNRIYIDKNENSNDMYISMDVEVIYGVNIMKEIEKLNRELRKDLEKATSVNVSNIDIKVVGIETDPENLKKKERRAIEAKALYKRLMTENARKTKEI